MKNILLLFILLTVPGWAQTLKFESFLVRIPASNRLAEARILDSSQWEQGLRSGQLQILESTSTLGADGMEAAALLGHKIPIAYYDPRVEDSQVQYVDSGFKFEAKVRRVSAGVFRTDVRMEQRHDVAPMQAKRPDQVGVLVVTTTLLRSGQFAILGKTRGHMTSAFLKGAYPNANIGEADTIALCFRITGP